jgi:hypothetical protein
MENRNTLYKMRKIVTHIDCPEEWQSTNDWDSHRPLIYLTINKIPHSGFVEYGMGNGSTPKLKEWYTEINTLGKEYYSIETNKEWADKFITDDYKKSPLGNKIYKNHCIVVLDEYLVVALPDSIVFVDSAPAETRKDIIERNQDMPVLIIHDTEEGAEYVYGMKEILNTFKYRLDYQPEGKPHTTAVSNFVDLTKWVD